MSHQKDKHYWTQLRGALTAGQWSAKFPARTPQGVALPWSELFRKFNKHCKGFADVAEVASQTHALALLLAANSNDEDQDDTIDGEDYPLDLGTECLLPEERVEEASAGYQVLKQLESSNFDTLNFALAYYSYALGKPSECLAYLSKVPDVSHLQNHIPAQATQVSIRSSTTGLHVPGFGGAPSFSSAGGSFVSLADSSAPEIKDGRAWAMTETVRSLCLQGMSHEQLLPSDPHDALKYYGAAIPLLILIVSEIAPRSAPTLSGKIDLTSFTQFRELWRWVERLLWRTVALSSRTSNIQEDRPEGDVESVWTWLGHYSACSKYWPADFRTVHRSTVSALYLRALILKHGHRPSTPLELSDSPPWLSTARSIVNDYRGILSVSTRFPRAGERNTLVEDFTDLCVGIWEASGAVGEHSGWVVDVLWWATRLTFNSYRILRHMSRIFYASGDTRLAKRTLNLYIQVVGKAWQASSESLGDDTDSNQAWVETLVSGARMLCKCASEGPNGIKDVREAGCCLEKARTRLDNNNHQLVASVDLAEGVWHSTMALAEQDPHTRPTHLSQAHALFLRSVEADPTPAGHFHLALSFARPGASQDLTQAIENAGLAVEKSASEIRYWHLLGLLLAATEQWKAATEILERGAELGEAEDTGSVDDHATIGTMGTDGQTLKPTPSIFTNGESIQATDITTNGSINGTVDSLEGDIATPTPKLPVYLVDRHTGQIPPSSQLLNPVLDHPPPSKQELFEYALQLRMTQVTLTEVMEGAEGAEVKWVDIFAWIAEKKGTGSEPTPRPSIDGGKTSEASPSVIMSLPPDQPLQNVPASVSVLSEKGAELAVQPPPITVSLATPETEMPPVTRVTSERSEKKGRDTLRVKRSSSVDRDASKSKKVQQMLKNRVHKSQARITTISRKIGNGVVRTGSLKRASSTPDFHAVLRQTSYQASSIHSRRRLSSIIHHQDDRTPTESPPPPPPVPPPQDAKRHGRTARGNRLLADLWLMSAATFRRLGKIEQARGAIQEAEVRDEAHAAVWVQLGLYYVALGQTQRALDTFQKALFISLDDVAASVHLARLYLSMAGLGGDPDAESRPSNVDLAAGILSHVTRGAGWDVPEAWYFLAKAYGMQGRKERERECLSFALALSETRGIRDIGLAVGWCL